MRVAEYAAEVNAMRAKRAKIPLPDDIDENFAFWSPEGRVTLDNLKHTSNRRWMKKDYVSFYHACLALVHPSSSSLCGWLPFACRSCLAPCGACCCVALVSTTSRWAHSIARLWSTCSARACCAWWSPPPHWHRVSTCLAEPSSLLATARSCTPSRNTHPLRSCVSVHNRLLTRVATCCFTITGTAK